MSTHEAYEQRLAGLGTRLRTVEAQNTALRAQRDALKTALQGLATLAKDIPAHRGNPLGSASWENAYGLPRWGGIAPVPCHTLPWRRQYYSCGGNTYRAPDGPWCRRGRVPLRWTISCTHP